MARLQLSGGAPLPVMVNGSVADCPDLSVTSNADGVWLMQAAFRRREKPCVVVACAVTVMPAWAWDT